LSAAERGGIVMMAEIATRRALQGDKPEPRRKWTKAFRVISG
jgi:hypothetical protein